MSGLHVVRVYHQIRGSATILIIMKTSPLAGKPVDPSRLVDVSRLVTAYFTGRPDPGVAAQRVAFGTSGHRGSSFDLSFNEAHIVAISQAICLYRKQQNI